MSCWRYLQTTFLTLLNKTCCKWSLEVNIFDPKWIIGNVDSTFQVWLQSKLMISSPKWIFNPYVILREADLYVDVFLFWLRFAYERYVYFSIHTVSSQALFFDDFMPIRANVNIFCQNTVEVKPFGVINIYIDVFIFRKLNRESKPKNPKWRNYFYSVFLSESFSVMLVSKILFKVGQIYNRVRLHNSDINAYCILIQYTVYSYSIQHTHTVYSTLNFLGQHVNDRFALWKFQA